MFLIVVNAAYTSQIDSRYGILKGIRKGDQFYCFDKVVLDADYNAALNILSRLEDSEINLHTPFQKVKEILIERTKHWEELVKISPVVEIDQPRL